MWAGADTARLEAAAPGFGRSSCGLTGMSSCSTGHRLLCVIGPPIMQRTLGRQPAHWIVTITIVCALALTWPLASQAVDYHLDRVPLPSQPRQGCTEFTKWMNVLHVDGLPEALQTDSSAHCQSASKYQQPDYGLDASTIKVGWLDEHKLLYVSWSSFSSYGSGRYRFEGHVVIGVLEGKVSELLRTTFQAYGRAGACGEGSTTFTVERDQGSGQLRFVQVDTLDTPPDDEGRCEQDKVKREWRYSLTEKGLVYVGGLSWWNTGDQSLAPKVIAAGRHLSIAQLHRLNPDLKDKLWTGWIVIADRLPPYTPDHESLGF